jgi:hypothetical protein
LITGGTSSRSTTKIADARPAPASAAASAADPARTAADGSRASAKSTKAAAERACRGGALSADGQSPRSPALLHSVCRGAALRQRAGGRLGGGGGRVVSEYGPQQATTSGRLCLCLTQGRATKAAARPSSAPAVGDPGATATRRSAGQGPRLSGPSQAAAFGLGGALNEVMNPSVPEPVGLEAPAGAAAPTRPRSSRGPRPPDRLEVRDLEAGPVPPQTPRAACALVRPPGPHSSPRRPLPAVRARRQTYSPE